MRAVYISQLRLFWTSLQIQGFEEEYEMNVDGNEENCLGHGDSPVQSLIPPLLSCGC